MVKKTKQTFSRRSGILRFVLECINSELYDDQGSYVIFGSNKDEIIREDWDQGYQRPQDVDAIREMHSDFVTQLGRSNAKQGTSIGDAPVFKRLRGTERLFSDGQQRFSRNSLVRIQADLRLSVL